jgi:hypothetical protein
MRIGGIVNKRNWQVKVKGKPPFSMGGLEDGECAEHICLCIFGDRLEWVC